MLLLVLASCTVTLTSAVTVAVTGTMTVSAHVALIVLPSVLHSCFGKHQLLCYTKVHVLVTGSDGNSSIWLHVWFLTSCAAPGRCCCPGAGSNSCCANQHAGSALFESLESCLQATVRPPVVRNFNYIVLPFTYIFGCFPWVILAFVGEPILLTVHALHVNLCMHAWFSWSDFIEACQHKR